MFSERLKEETKENHQALERLLIPRIKAIKTKDDYSSLLSLFYKYFGGLEQKIDRVVDHELLPDYAERRKTSSIADDIHALGGTVPAFSDTQPEINDHQQALGALYVIEGSALGGKIISKMISQALGDAASPALSFYQGYGENTDEMWATFKGILNEQLISPAEQDRVLAAANETFLRFKQLAEKEA